MGGKLDQTKGPITEDTGVLVDGESLTSERKVAHVVGKVQEKVERVKGKLEQAVDQMKEALRGKRSRRSAKW
jgi:uncharacterized protein YjbJ (UPF0337 family)